MNKLKKIVAKAMNKRASLTKNAAPLYYPNESKTFEEEKGKIKVTIKRVDDHNSILVNIQIEPEDPRKKIFSFDGIIRPVLNEQKGWGDYNDINEYLKDTMIYENKEDFKGYGNYIGNTIRELIEIVDGIPALNKKAQKNKANKLASIIHKEILKSAKVSKKADIDQRLSYGHFIKQEDENKLPKFNTLEDIKKYIKSTNRFPDNFFYKGGLFTEDEYDLDGMYVTYGSPEIDKAIVINTPNNRYNHKGNYKNLDIEIKEEDSPDFRTDINYTLPIKVYEKYFPKKQSSKANKMTKKAFTYEDEKAALAKFLNIKEEDLTKNEENFYFGLPEFTTKNGEEYRISASESVIRGAVAESLENLFNDLGLDEFKEKVLPYVGDMERYFSVSESKFYDQALEELRNVDEIEDPSEEQIEAKQKEIIDNYGSAEEFFIEVGDEYIKEMINYGDASFDFEKMAEDVISEYGAGHELASYDNDTNEIEYNGKTYYIFRQQ